MLTCREFWPAVRWIAFQPVDAMTKRAFALSRSCSRSLALLHQTNISFTGRLCNTLLALRVQGFGSAAPSCPVFTIASFRVAVAHVPSGQDSSRISQFHGHPDSMAACLLAFIPMQSQSLKGDERFENTKVGPLMFRVNEHPPRA
jgi:hypothetical protein